MKFFYGIFLFGAGLAVVATLVGLVFGVIAVSKFF